MKMTWLIFSLLMLTVSSRASAIEVYFRGLQSCEPRLTSELLVQTGETAIDRRARDSRRAADMLRDLALPAPSASGSDPILDTLHAHLRSDDPYSERAVQIHRLFRERFDEMPTYRDVAEAARGSRLYQAVADYSRFLEIAQVKEGQRGLHRFTPNMEVSLVHPPIRLPIWQLRKDQYVYVLNGDHLNHALIRNIEMFENQPYGVIRTPNETLETTAGQRIHTYRGGATPAGDITKGDSFIHLETYTHCAHTNWVEGGTWEPAPEPGIVFEVTLNVPHPFFVQGLCVESANRK